MPCRSHPRVSADSRPGLTAPMVTPSLRESEVQAIALESRA
jgi:hypothetical protein